MMLQGDNVVVKLCAEGAMQQADSQKAAAIYEQAWSIAQSDEEKLIAAHYVAKVQADPYEELHWNLLALHHATHISNEGFNSYLPSLYLNAGKSYEALNNKEEATYNYRLAQKYQEHLAEDGYGDMIKRGIALALGNN